MGIMSAGPRRHVARRAAVTLGILALAACGHASSADEPGTPAEAPPTLLGAQDVAVAQHTDLASGTVLTGSLQPYRIVQVKSQIAGTVRGVTVDRGTPVHRGQALATIEAAGVQSQAVAAKANLALAKQKLDAAETLYEAGAMSAIDARTARAAYEAAQAEAARAEEAASRSRITAPISGVVSERAVDGGEAVGVDAMLFTVVNTDTLELAGQIPVELAADVRVGAPVTFTLAAEPGRVLTGRLARIEPVADAQTRQVGVYIQLPNRRHSIIGGQFATGRIVGERVRDAVVVPESAIRGSGDSTHVLVVAGDRVQSRPVTVGARDASTGRVAVASGLEGGERVIVTPTILLAPGTKVALAADAAAVAGRDTTDAMTQGGGR